ncbi:MAG: serine hydrolase [Pseudomonadota bacterium]
MYARILAALLVIMPLTSACATTPEISPTPSANAPPATVVVAFGRDSITPLIVEGARNRETGEPVEANDPVRIASISKLIMSLATLRLVDEGKVDLNADVSDYLGWQVRSPNFPDAKVTLAQLLSHRSGLRDTAGYVIPLGESLEAKLAEPEAWFADSPPGEAPFEYANLGSPVVATVLEAATGERYDRILERTVFAPLDVEACVNWVGCSDEMVTRAITLYRDTGEIARDDPDDLPPNCTIPVAEGAECVLENYVPGTNASIFSPQGGVRIGMIDLAKIGQALLIEDERLIASDTLLKMKESVRESFDQREATRQDFFCVYGYAVQVIDLPDSPCQDRLFEDYEPRVGHAGEAYGLRAGLWFSPGPGGSFGYFTTEVPPRQSAEDEGGFDPREIALMARAQELLAKDSND